MRSWTLDPHSGGVAIPKALQREVERRLNEHTAKRYANACAKLGLRFRGQFLYVDAYKVVDPKAKPWAKSKESDEAYRERLRNTPTHLCRLRHFGRDRWSLAFYKYSDEKYEPCFFHSNEWFGTPEEGLDVGAQVYLLE